MACYQIMAVLVSHRSQKAPQLQEVLTQSGCIIKTRLGLHEAGDVCSEEGLIILQLAGEPEAVAKLETTLNAMAGITAKSMEICS